MTARGETIGSEQFAGLTLADGQRWGMAAAVVLGLVVTGVAMTRNGVPPVTVAGPVDPVILLDLAPAPATPRRDKPAPVEPPEPQTQAQPAPAPAAIVPEPALEQTEPVDLPPPEEDRALPPVPEPAIGPAPVSVPAPTLAEPAPSAMPLPATMSAALSQQRAKTPPTSRSRPAATPRPPASAAKPASRPAAASTASASGALMHEWQAQVLRRLDRNKIYPRTAQRLKQEGVVQISFAVDAAGHLSNIRVIGSSGSAELDRAAIETVQRASPVPRPPASGGQRNLSLAAAIHFAIR